MIGKQGKMTLVREESGPAIWDSLGQIMPHGGRNHSIVFSMPEVNFNRDILQPEPPRAYGERVVQGDTASSGEKRLPDAVYVLLFYFRARERRHIRLRQPLKHS
jgi:hypothetical protein